MSKNPSTWFMDILNLVNSDNFYRAKFLNFCPIFWKLGRNGHPLVGHFDQLSKNWVKIVDFLIIAG